MEGNNNFNQNQYQLNQTNNFNQEPINQNNQVLEKKEGSNKLLVVALVMSFIAVIALAYFYTDIKNEYTSLKADQINNPSSCAKPEEEKNEEIQGNQVGKLKVIDAYSTIIDYGPYKGKAIKIPKIDGSSKAIENLNNKILNNSLDSVMSYKDFMMEQLAYENDGKIIPETEGFMISNFYDCYRSFDFSYKSFTKNDVLTIKVNYELNNSTLDEGNCWNATGDSFDADEYYFYDIKNDKEMTFKEAAEKFNATFAEESECKSVTDLSDLTNWGTVEIELDENHNMKIECWRDVG